MNPSRNNNPCQVYEETLTLPLTPNMMKNFVISVLVLVTFLSSCTPAYQVAQSTPASSPAKSSTPAFKTWVDKSGNSTEAIKSEELAIAEPDAKKEETLEAAYARFRKNNSSNAPENSGTSALINSPQKTTLSPAPTSKNSTFRTSSTQSLPTQSQEDPEVIRVYIDSNKPVVVKLIEGAPDGIQIIREVAVPPKEVKYQYPHMKQEASKAPAKVDPAVLKNAPYVQKEVKKAQAEEDPQDFMMAMMEDKKVEAQDAISQTRAGQVEEELPVEIKKILAKPSPQSHIVPVYLAGNQSINIDENLLRQWEKKIVDARMGIDSATRLPRWLLQGLEWVTHAEKAEPKRSETIMPLYRQLESRGHLDGINLNQMTPVQVVRKIRVLVDELKASNGQLSMN